MFEQWTIETQEWDPWENKNNAGELYNCPGSLSENAFPVYVTLRWNSDNAQISHWLEKTVTRDWVKSSEVSGNCVEN